MAFDRIASLGARHFQVPICLISLVDSDRQWFKAASGLDARQICRDAAFCTHTIMPGAPEIFEVPDAKLDVRWAFAVRVCWVSCPADCPAVVLFAGRLFDWATAVAASQPRCPHPQESPLPFPDADERSPEVGVPPCPPAAVLGRWSMQARAIHRACCLLKCVWGCAVLGLRSSAPTSPPLSSPACHPFLRSSDPVTHT